MNKKHYRCTECLAYFTATSPRVYMGCCFGDSVVKVKHRKPKKKINL